MTETTFDPGLRSMIELLYGREPTRQGEVRGATVRGRARYSPHEAVRDATRELLPRLTTDLRSFARRRPACGYAHDARTQTCRDAVCQAWVEEVVAWHSERFGPRHFDVTLGAVLWMSTGRELSLDVSDGSWRDDFNPASVALDVIRKNEWVTAQLGIHRAASKSDVHDLIDRVWPHVESLRAASQSGLATSGRSNGRAGRLDRPARATYWRLRRFQGLSHPAILEEWEELTRTWAALAENERVDPRRAEYPAWLEWRRRGVLAEAERLEEVGTVQRGLAKLRRLTA